MSKMIDEITVGLHVEYRIVFFPFATFKRIGDVAILTVLGIPVYKRAGGARGLFGVVWRAS